MQCVYRPIVKVERSEPALAGRLDRAVHWGCCKQEWPFRSLIYAPSRLPMIRADKKRADKKRPALFRPAREVSDIYLSASRY